MDPEESWGLRTGSWGLEEPRGEESAHWLVELAELRVCVGLNGTDAMIAGQTKLAVFIDGWISEALGTDTRSEPNS